MSIRMSYESVLKLTFKPVSIVKCIHVDINDIVMFENRLLFIERNFLYNY